MTSIESPSPDYRQPLQQAAAHHQAGRLQEARALYLAVLEIEPQQPDAHYNLGVLGMQAKTPLAAVDHFQTALQARPGEGRYWLSAAMAMMDATLPEAALSVLLLSLRRGVGGNGAHTLLQRLGIPVPQSAGVPPAPQPAQKEVNRLLSLVQSRQHGQVEKLARRVTQEFPRYSPGWMALGLGVAGLGRLEEALQHFKQSIQLGPLEAQAFVYLGSTLTLLGRLNEAEVNFRQALFLQPGHAEAHCSRARNFFRMHEWELVEASCLQAIRFEPKLTEAHNILGAVMYEMGRLKEAELHCRRAIELEPARMEAYTTLGNILQDAGEFDAVESLYQRALKIQPHFHPSYHNRLFTLNYHPDKSAEEIFQVYRDFNTHIGAPLHALQRPSLNDRSTTRRLKVGYVSPDFRQHAMRNFIEPVLAHHRAEAVEVFAYAELTQGQDAVTERLRAYVDHWIPTVGMSDQALAERVRADGIDVLVDLAGHTAFNRLAVFALKPAPVSVSWLGFGYTTGLTAIDYFLTDASSAPEGSESLFSETPWRLPTTAYAYRPVEGMGEASPLPALQNGRVTFGTLTRAIRINHKTIRVWAAILKRISGARLVINSLNFRDLVAQQQLRDKFVALGVQPDQLQIGYTSPPWDVLRSIDIGLDCFPHNSGTTLFETLYMGLPYITLAGRPSVGRIGSAILHEVGHPEWIATSEGEYIDKACALAADLPALAKIRAGLRQEMQASALMDEAGFTRRLEDAYREMFARWAASPPAAPAA